jgi:hypothetical protein
MKLKNHYVWMCAIWIISTLLQAVACCINFINGETIKGIAYLCFAIGFAFVSGILYNNAKKVSKYNHYLDKIEKAFDLLATPKKEKEQTPFDEFDVPFPEVKKEKNNE